MCTARVVVRLKPGIDPLDDAVQNIATAEKPTLLIKKTDAEDGIYQFNFTQVLSKASQHDTFQVCGKGIIDSVLGGYNGTILAYGQTGSGKTFTMTGEHSSLQIQNEAEGITPRALQQLFKGLKGRDLLHWQVRISYLEIYNDLFRDLLSPETLTSELGIVDNKGVVTVKNARYVECHNVRQALNVLKEGLASRQVAAHNLNSQSSRSHTIFSVWLDTVDAEGVPLASKLNLVDLAGSERFAKTGTQGSMAKEAMQINKSLTFLEQTVIALARKRQYVPFRSCKLTHFLKDSIGGNCKTLLIACVWSDAAQVSETLSTCRFAQRMLQVTENAQQNTGSLSSVHGNLYKLDPVMQQYLERMTATAVAREKAQLYAEFARLKSDQGQELGEAELLELESLRHRVRELERLQSQVQEPRGSTLVSEASLEEVETLRQRVLQLESDMAQQSSARHQSTALLQQERAPNHELGPQPIAAAAEAADAAERRLHSWQAERPGEVAEAEHRSAIGQAGGLQPTASQQAAEELSLHKAAAASDPQAAGSGQSDAALEGADRHLAAAEQQSEDENRFVDPPASLNRTDSHSSAESVHFADPEGNMLTEAMQLGHAARPPIAAAATAELAPAEAPAMQHVLDAEIAPAKLVNIINEHDGEQDTNRSASPLTAAKADPPTAAAQQTAQSEEVDAMLPGSPERRAAAAAGVTAFAGAAAVLPLAAVAAAPEPWPAQEDASVPPAPPGELETPFHDRAAEGSCQEAAAAEVACSLPVNRAGDGGIARSDAGGSSLEEGEDDGGLAEQDVPEPLDGDVRLSSFDQPSEQQTGAIAESVGLSETAAAADVAIMTPAPTAEGAQQLAEQSGLDAALALAQHTPDAAHILAPKTEAGKQVAGLPRTRAASIKDIIMASGAERETPRMPAGAKGIGAQEQGMYGPELAPPWLALPGMWPPPPEVSSLRSPSVASAWAPDVNHYYEAEMAAEARKKKRGLFSRLFGKRRHEEHDSFSHFAPPEALEDEAPSPTIVILNSLNHNQLLELLKARPLRNGPAGSLPAIEEGENLAPSTPEHSAVKPAVEISTSESGTSLPQALAFQTSPSDSLSPSSVFSNSPASSQLPFQPGCQNSSE